MLKDIPSWRSNLAWSLLLLLLVLIGLDEPSVLVGTARGFLVLTLSYIGYFFSYGMAGRVLGLPDEGPCGYEVYRLIKETGHDCVVVAPSLIPKKPGERVKDLSLDPAARSRAVRSC